MAEHRRQFLAKSTAITLGAFPSLFHRIGTAAENQFSRNDERILVVVQMTGGNDGINTLVPYTDEGYTKYRKRLRLPIERLIKINDTVALHPAMRSAADLLEMGKLAIVQGVGYPNPSRSHDTSLAIWHSAQIGDEATVRTHGWLGRAVDNARPEIETTADAAPPMILLGNESQPLAIQSRRSTAVTLSNLTELRMKAPHLQANVHEPARAINEIGQFIQQTKLNAIATATALEHATKQDATRAFRYPSTRLGERLQSISSLIKISFGTKIFYTIQEDYDTHASQLPAHAQLLRDFSESTKAFLLDLSESGLSERVCVLGFSEFGRRVEENGTEGTDHGTSGPVFIAGDGIRPGLLGQTPQLLDTIDGDLRMHVDFRSVYREIANDWLGLNVDSSLLPAIQELQLFKKHT